MPEIMQIAHRQVEVRRRYRQRHMHLYLDWQGVIRVTCNRTLGLRSIQRFVLESEEFIQKREAELNEQKTKYPSLELLSGEQLEVEGLSKTIEILWTWGQAVKVSELAENVVIKCPLTTSKEERRSALVRHFRRRAKAQIGERLNFWSQQMGLAPKRFSIRDQATRWGSCSESGNVNFNWKLILTPPSVLDYVLVHELAHLVHFNHSKEFWSLVELHMPTYKLEKSWLKKNEIRLRTLLVSTSAIEL